MDCPRAHFPIPLYYPFKESFNQGYPWAKMGNVPKKKASLQKKKKEKSGDH